MPKCGMCSNKLDLFNDDMVMSGNKTYHVACFLITDKNRKQRKPRSDIIITLEKSQYHELEKPDTEQDNQPATWELRLLQGMLDYYRYART